MKCPITLEEIQDPYTATDGYTYERSALVKYIKLKHSNIRVLPEISSPMNPQLSLNEDIQLLMREIINAYYKPSRPRSDGLFSYFFSSTSPLNTDMSKIEIGQNFINLYFYGVDSTLNKLLDNYSIAQNINLLRDKHGEEFSICLDHLERKYDNPIFNRSNQSFLKDYFHPEGRGGSHAHYVYGWDSVSLRDLTLIFSYIQHIGESRIEQDEFLTLASNYVKFLAAKILAYLKGKDSIVINKIVELCMKIGYLKGCLFFPTGNLNPILYLIVNSIVQQDLTHTDVRKKVGNDHLIEVIKDLLHDLGEAPNSILLNANLFNSATQNVNQRCVDEIVCQRPERVGCQNTYGYGHLFPLDSRSAPQPKPQEVLSSDGCKP